MLTRRALDKLLNEVVDHLISLGLEPEKVILFGSYANGGVHPYSDVDIAVWSPKFIGEGMIDFELVRPIIRKFRHLDIKMFPSGADADSFPFISVIEKTGVLLDIEKMYNQSFSHNSLFSFKIL